jgi:hypothetical protein
MGNVKSNNLSPAAIRTNELARKVSEQGRITGEVLERIRDGTVTLLDVQAAATAVESVRFDSKFVGQDPKAIAAIRAEYDVATQLLESIQAQFKAQPKDVSLAEAKKDALAREMARHREALRHP